MAILKTSAETNVGQSHRLTHCIKNLHCYNLKSLIFKHSLLFIQTFKNTTQLLKTFSFVSQSLTNAISLRLSYSNSCKHVSDFSARKKKVRYFQFNFPHHAQAKVKSKSPLPGHTKWSNARGLPPGGGC